MAKQTKQQHDPIPYSVGVMKDTIKNRKLACATIVERGTLDLEQIAREIAKSTTVTKADIAAVLTALVEFSLEHLVSGYRLNLGDLGQLFPRLKAHCVKTKEECDESTIERVTCHFRTSMKLRAMLKEASFERTLPATQRKKGIKKAEKEMKEIMEQQEGE